MFDLTQVKILRVALGLTQAELATRAKLTIATISRIENGHKSYIKPATNKALTDALRVDAYALLAK